MKLETYRQRHGLSYAALAEAIGLGPERAKDVFRFCRRGVLPRDDRVMSRIVEATGGAVTPNDWYDIPGLPIVGEDAA